MSLEGIENGTDDVFVVIAAFNEERSLASVLGSLTPRYRNVVVVDDGSIDDTGAIARRHARWTLSHIVNRGQGAALQTGIDFAVARGAKYVVTFDADGQHDPEDIEKLLEPLRADECDITLGSRFLGTAEGIPRSRKLMLRAAARMTSLISGVRLTDAHNGLRAMTCDAASRIELTMDRMAHANEIIDLVGQLLSLIHI